VKEVKIFYIESFTCIDHLSLTGKLVYHICDRFFVQWEDLLSLSKGQYTGRLPLSSAAVSNEDDQDNTEIERMFHDSEQRKRRVFVTVGTTNFDDLIRAVTTEEFLNFLKEKNFSMTIQFGTGSYPPPSSTAIEIDSFRLKDDLSEDFQKADIVISHAGAGTILDALEKHKRLIVVPNKSLMNNHQEQLAVRLAKEKYVTCCSSHEIRSTFEKVLSSSSSPIDIHKLRRFPQAEAPLFKQFVGQELGLA